MTPSITTFARTCIFIAVFLAGGNRLAVAGNLYEDYVNSDENTLREETREMSNRLASVFSQDSVASRQQQIDFAEYYANIKKLIRFGGKLAGYSEYERDLEFARDNEIFKGLPDDNFQPGENKERFNRKEFVHSKYKMMKKNLQDEIDTYLDLMEMALDGCEILANNDLSGILSNEKYRERIVIFTRSDAFSRYEKKRHRLANRWPEMEARIAMQLALWQIRPPSEDQPLIEITITEAL